MHRQPDRFRYQQLEAEMQQTDKIVRTVSEKSIDSEKRCLLKLNVSCNGYSVKKIVFSYLLQSKIKKSFLQTAL